MHTSSFLERLADEHGAQTLHGAIVFVMLERPLDVLISKCLALDPHHRGEPSPWSHCFLLAEPYHGPSTRILDCTVRDAEGHVEWESSLRRTVEVVIAGTIGSGVGGIYEATVSDYDDARVSAFGVKWLPHLTKLDRARIVERARELQRRAPRYDLVGLFRSLVRLVTGVLMKPSAERLYCSAFTQAAYRAALADDGAFQQGLPDQHTTPDDIWYSAQGHAVARAAVQTLRLVEHNEVAQRLGRQVQVGEMGKIDPALQTEAMRTLAPPDHHARQAGLFHLPRPDEHNNGRVPEQPGYPLNLDSAVSHRRPDVMRPPVQ